MRLLFRSLSVLLLIVVSPWLPCFKAQVRSGDAPALDALLQDYAYRAFVRPKTGVVFDGTVPSNLTGIKVSGMRLRTGSLFKRGVHPPYKEFEIPKGVVVQPHVERIVLVYQNLGSLSSVYYPLPDSYTYLAPVVGLLAYDAKNLSAKNLPDLDIIASKSSIHIRFSNAKPVPDGSTPMCMWFDLQGSVNLSNVVSENTCSMTEQGHFALVVEGIALAPSPAPAPETSGSSSTSPKKKKTSKRNMKKAWIIVGSIVGGIFLLILLGMLLACLRKYRTQKRMSNMEKASEGGEALRMTTVGSAKAPTAMVTRTQPNLETEYAP